jgi:hypothetical protein
MMKLKSVNKPLLRRARYLGVAGEVEMYVRVKVLKQTDSMLEPLFREQLRIPIKVPLYYGT